MDFSNSSKKSRVESLFGEHLISSEKNYKYCHEKFQELIRLIHEIFDCQQNIFNSHFWTQLGDFHKPNENKIILNASYYKNTMSFVSSTEMTLRGFYGSARIILRQIFEFLIIGKYSSISEDSGFTKHWIQGGQINIGRQILNKLKKPNTAEFNALYEALCNYNHATPYAQQIGLSFERNQSEIQLNLVVILALLECNYHLLNTHYIDSTMRYYGLAYQGEEVKNNKKKLKELFASNRKYLGKPSLAVIKDYKSTWHFKN
jgi:hypothetical protein